MVNMKNIFKNIKKYKPFNRACPVKLSPFNGGLTMVELLVTLAIFAVLSVSIINLFTNSINAQSAIFQNQQLLNDSGYAVEYMHKAIRMAYRDDGTLSGSTAGDCTATANNNYNVVGGDSIYFLGYDNILGQYKCLKFYLDSSTHRIMMQQSSDFTYGNADLATAIELTSSQSKVNDLNFSVTGDNSGGVIGTTQPKVTIMLDMESNNKRVSPIPKIVIQTTASQRNLNAPYTP